MRRALVSLAVGAALLALPASAPAHAVLERSEPSGGQTLASPPAQIVLEFSEPVEASFGSIRVFDAAGDQIETGPVERPGGGGEAIAVAPTSELADGSYTVTYRVISADSHPVGGGFTFSVGAGAEPPAQTVSELLDASDARAVTSAAFWVVRWIGYIAIGAAIGLAGFLLLVWMRRREPQAAEDGGPAGAGADDGFDRRFRRVTLTVAAAGIAASLAALALQGATAAAISAWSALDPGVIGDVAATRYGRVALVRAAAFALLGLFAVAPVPRAALWIPAAILAVSPALAGHASTHDPALVLFPANVAHVAAMGLWFGGICAALAVLPAATRRLAPADRSSTLAASLGRFSAVALVCVLVLTASGVAQALVYLDSPSELIDTGFGRAILVKALLLAGLVAIGALNRRRLLPALDRVVARAESPGRAGVAIRRALIAEVALIVAALAITATLVTHQPPAEAGSGPVSGSTEVGDALLDYTVDPAAVGQNQIHLYLFDAADGSQYEAAREVTASLALPEEDIGPIEVALTRTGPGHYIAPAAPFATSGDWTVTVAVRVSRFDQDEAKFEVPIR